MKTFVIGIDGNCGSGKSTLSQILKEHFDCNVFHMDDYYLPFSKREDNWEMIPGGNMDIQRFLNQVLLPAKEGKQVIYQPYFCRENRLLEATIFPAKSLTVVEGSYSHHPVLAELCDVKLFLTCSKEEQTRRLLAREGERFPFYEERWIPMEERFYQAFAIKEQADRIVETKDYSIYQELVEFVKRCSAI